MGRDMIVPGKIVTILFLDSKNTLNVSINNGSFYKDSDIVYISPEAPLSKAIINHQQDEEVEFNSPEGRLKIKIVKVSD